MEKFDDMFGVQESGQDSPGIESNRWTPEQMEEIRRIAEGLHAKRIEGKDIKNYMK